MATDLQLYDLESGLDELRSWCAYQRSLPENERTKLSNTGKTYLRTKRGYVIAIQAPPKSTFLEDID